jgi:dUTP pyrophosphatase
MKVRVPVKRLDHGKGLDLPEYMSDHASGMDIRAAIDSAVEIKPMERVLIPTGLALAIPEGYEVQIRPRSGLAIKHGITVINSPGTIDADYRGEIKVGLVNLSDAPWIVERGQRIAQMVLSRVWHALWDEMDKLPETGRGKGGFGHSGI